MSTAVAAQPVIPEHWPAATPVAVAARPVSWLLFLPALLLAPFFPRTLGPRLGLGSWTKACLAHILSALAGAIIVRYATWVVREGPAVAASIRWPADPLEALRIELVRLVNAAYEFSEGRGDIYMVLAVILGCHALWWLLPAVLMPFLAAGERSRLLYGRAVKLALWSSSSGLALVALLSLLAVMRVVDVGIWDQYLGPENLTAAFFLGIVWWLTVLLRLGADYAGPPDGPGWQPLPALCEACGYSLAGLPADGRCPECGRPAAESDPQRRGPPEWARASRLRRPVAYLRTVALVIRDGRFFERVATRAAVPAATGFALATALLLGVILTISAIPVLPLGMRIRWEIRDPATVSRVLTLAATAGMAGVALFMLLGLIALRVAHFGRRDLRPAIVAIGYGAALLIPGATVVGLFQWLLSWLGDRVRFGWEFQLPLVGRVDEAAIVQGLFMLPALALFTWGLARMRRAVAAVRYAGS